LNLTIFGHGNSTGAVVISVHILNRGIQLAVVLGRYRIQIRFGEGWNNRIAQVAAWETFGGPDKLDRIRPSSLLSGT